MWKSLTTAKPNVNRKKWENCLLWGLSQCKWIHPCTTGVQIYLEILSDALWIEAFGDHHYPSLDAETQSNLCSCLVVLFANGIQHRILQQRRGGHIYPEENWGQKTKKTLLIFHVKTQRH